MCRTILSWNSSYLIITCLVSSYTEYHWVLLKKRIQFSSPFEPTKIFKPRIWMSDGTGANQIEAWFENPCELIFVLSWIFRSKAPWFHCIVCILLFLDLVICDSETSESLSKGLGWLRGEIIKRKGGDEALQVMKSGKATLTGNHTSAFLQKMKHILSPAWEHYFSGLPFKTSLPPD